MSQKILNLDKKLKINKGRKSSSKNVVIKSDIHVGANTAICSSEPQIVENGITIKQNKLQKTLYEFWLECEDNYLQKNPYLLVINGEPINGGNGKSRGRDNWTTNIHDQILDFKELMKLTKYQNIMFTRGSDYHVMIDNGSTPAEELIAHDLNAIPYTNFYDKNRYSDYFLDFQLNGKIFNVAHHIAGSRWSSYRPMSLSREMANLALEDGRLFSHEEKPNFIIRGHTHHYVHIGFKHTFGWVNGCWKYADGFLYKGGVAGVTPDIGCLEIVIEQNGEWSYKFHTIPEKRLNRKLVNL